MKRKILYEKIANKLEDTFNGYPVLYKKSGILKASYTYLLIVDINFIYIYKKF